MLRLKKKWGVYEKMNTIGNIFRCTTWGESHGQAIGCVIDGCPSNIELSEEDINRELERDVPIQMLGTPRKESNKAQILSGISNNKTLGTPISIIIPNNNQRSKDYSSIQYCYRPGHGEFGYHARYGIYEYCGGGRASGRECVGRLSAGAIAKKILSKMNIFIESEIIELGGVKIYDSESYDKAVKKCLQVWEDNNDTTGGVIKLIVKGLKPGIGNPVFGKLNAEIFYALSTIGGVKGIEQGLGFDSARVKGSEFNDGYRINENNNIELISNNCGGTVAGISTGSDLEFKIAVKPTPSIGHNQKTVNWHKFEETDLKLSGRFDMNFTPRVAVVAESMISIILVDQILLSRKGI